MAHRRELQRHTCDCRRIRPVRTMTRRGSRIIDDFARILKVILDEVRACRDVADTIRRRYRRAPARDNVLVPLLHELFRIDVTRQRIEVVALAVTAVEGKHLVQEIGTVRVACIVKEGCLTIIERLGEATVTWYVLIRDGERLAQIRLPRKDIAVTELGIAERNDLLDLRLHLARNRGPVAAVLILVVVRALDRLRLERLLDVLHARQCRLGCVHPRDARFDAVLIAVVLAFGDVVAQVARVVHGVVRGTVELLPVALFHEFRLGVVQLIQIFLVALHHVVATDTNHRSSLTFRQRPCC